MRDSSPDYGRYHSRSCHPSKPERVHHACALTESINASISHLSARDIASQHPREVRTTVSSLPSSLSVAACTSALASLSHHAAVSSSAGTSRRERSPPSASSVTPILVHLLPNVDPILVLSCITFEKVGHLRGGSCPRERPSR